MRFLCSQFEFSKSYYLASTSNKKCHYHSRWTTSKALYAVCITERESLQRFSFLTQQKLVSNCKEPMGEFIARQQQPRIWIFFKQMQMNICPFPFSFLFISLLIKLFNFPILYHNIAFQHVKHFHNTTIRVIHSFLDN